jgi:hypothetical protein
MSYLGGLLSVVSLEQAALRDLSPIRVDGEEFDAEGRNSKKKLLPNNRFLSGRSHIYRCKRMGFRLPQGF